MPRPIFSRDELNPTGKMYPGLTFPPIPETPVLNRPISPRENLQLMFEGRKPYWIPTSGWFFSDSNQFRPRMNLDNLGNRQVYDGGPKIPYEDYGKVIKSDWFDTVWIWGEAEGGSTYSHGNPKIKDMTRWEEFISFPNLDNMDWDTCASQNVKYLDVDKMNQLGITCGLWERLMALLDVVEACMALYEEDQKPAVHRFFDQYTDVLIDYIRRMADICNIHSVMLHEDWAHKRGPFFSPETAREMLLPYIQRIVDYCHSRGLSYEIHCCGASELLMPVFIETGADIWNGQSDANDLGGLAKKYKDSQMIFGVPIPILGPDANDDEIISAARAWVEEYKDCRVSTIIMRPNVEGIGPYNHHQKLLDAIYEFSRIAYQDED